MDAAAIYKKDEEKYVSAWKDLQGELLRVERVVTCDGRLEAEGDHGAASAVNALKEALQGPAGG